MNFREIAAFIQENRQEANADWHFYTDEVSKHRRDGLTQTVDAFMESQGFRAIGNGWREIERRDECGELARLFSTSLAYVSELMKPKTARYVAEELLRNFHPYGRHTFSNADSEFGGRCWTSVTDATFDEAIVILDDSHIAVFCQEDED